MAFGVELADIAGMKPAVFKRGGGFAGRLKISCGHVFAAHQHFAIFGDFQFDPASGFPTVPSRSWKGWLSVTMGAVSVRP